MGVVVIGGGGSGGGGNPGNSPKMAADSGDVKAGEYVVATFASKADAEAYAAILNNDARVIPFYQPAEDPRA